MLEKSNFILAEEIKNKANKSNKGTRHHIKRENWNYNKNYLVARIYQVVYIFNRFM